MKKPLYILTTLLFLAVSGCKITGKYFSGDRYSNTSLTINADSTFTYATFHDIGGADTIEGKWTRNKKILILNSYEQPTFKPNSTLEKIISNQERKLIIVQNMELSACNSVISLNNGQEIDTLKGINDTTYWTDQFPFFVTGAYTSINPIKSIRILQTNNWTDCILKDSLFFISNPSANLIIVYAQPYNRYDGMKYLVNAEWKFNCNRIYLWRETKSKYS